MKRRRFWRNWTPPNGIQARSASQIYGQPLTQAGLPLLVLILEPDRQWSQLPVFDARDHDIGRSRHWAITTLGEEDSFPIPPGTRHLTSNDDHRLCFTSRVRAIGTSSSSR
jgi:hypothetical protein